MILKCLSIYTSHQVSLHLYSRLDALLCIETLDTLAMNSTFYQSHIVL